MSLNCAYHALGDTKVVEDDEYKKLITTGVWFDSPRSAWEYKYLYVSEYSEWPVVEGAHFLVGENPDKPPPIDTEKYQTMIKAIENDFIRGNLKLKERTNFKKEKIYFVLNVNLIQWATNRGFDIPDCCVNYKTSEPKMGILTPSALGKKGSNVSNKKHVEAKQIAMAIAEKVWKEAPDKTKEDVAALVQADFQKNKIWNGDETYSPSTICNWIKEVIPPNKRKGGRPRKAV